MFSSFLRSMGRCQDLDPEVEVVPRDPMAWLRSYLHGGTSSLFSMLTTMVTFPVYKTVFRQQLHNNLVRHAVKQLYREGPRKLYRGIIPPLVMKTLNGTLLFGLQDTILHQLSSPSFTSLIPLSGFSALAGLGAGGVEAIVFTPLERVQNVLQNSQNDRYFPTLRSVLARLANERLGIGLYCAFLPTLVRNALGSSMYFGLKDPLRAAMADQGLSPSASSFVSGMVNSMAISLPLYPLSVLIANMQARVGKETVAGAMETWNALWESRQRSVTLLYRGGSLVIVRSCLTWGITTAVYDYLAQHAC